jgi:hypothetical protein
MSVTEIEQIEAALQVAYKNRVSSGCGCCEDEDQERARCRALETLNQLLPKLSEQAKREAEW